MLFSFTGRLNRARYWLGSIGLVAAALILVFIAFVLTRHSVTSAAPIGLIFFLLVFLLMIWMTLALTTKRLHDRDKSAWLVLLFYVAPSILQGVGNSTGSFIPNLIGFGISIWGLIELGFLRGTAGQNSYGPDPLPVR